MIINHNMNAINTNRILGEDVKRIGGEMEKLSSGLRINRAADDAAGLSISEKLRSQSAGLAQGARNANDAISFLQTTEGHLAEVENVLQRMRVLSVQAANGTYTEEDRSAIQIEVDQLTDEIDRIAEQADFNKMKMLDNASGEANAKAADELAMVPAKINVPPSLENAQVSWTLRVQVGANADEAIAVNIYAANVSDLFAGEAGGEEGQQGEGAAAGPVNVMSSVDANSSIAKLDVALMNVNHQRSNLGAFQNRLESAVRSNNYAVENLTAADSRIRDTDMSAEMVSFAKDNILMQAAQAMLSQANQLPQGILRLLG